ncbi:MAG: carbohydrate kinase family protein [Anaerolineae bacterium]
MKLSFDAIVAGHICLDVIPSLDNVLHDTFEATFRPGRLIQAGAMTFSTGGPVANTGLALHKLGIAAQLMGKVGDDSFGQTIRQLVSAQGAHLAESMVSDPGVNTSYTIVINPPGVDRIFLHFPGANDTFQADDVDYELVAQAQLFHLGYPPVMRLMYTNDGTQLAETFRRAKATGVTTSLDMAVPDPAAEAGQADWIKILQATLPYVDLFLPSGEEILYMLQRETFDDMRRGAAGGDILPLFTPELLSKLSGQLLAMGAKVVAIKLGRRGMYLRTAGQATLQALGRAQPSPLHSWADKELWAPAFQAKEVGATGAGDASIAGFLGAMLRSCSLEETLIMATAVGACNVEAADGLTGIRSWEETQQRVAVGWPKHELALDTPDWSYEAGVGLWRRIK